MPDAVTGGAATPLGFTRLLALVLAGFGVLLLVTAPAATSQLGAAISAGLFWSYGLGGVLLLIQQTQIWMTAAGTVTVGLAALLTVGYGAAYLLHRGGMQARTAAG